MPAGHVPPRPQDVGDFASIVPKCLTPTLVDGATWQAGVTRHSHRYRVFLDGEPVAGAIAANVRGGWVDLVMPAPEHGNRWTESGQRGVKRFTGRVELVRDQYDQ